MQADPVDYGEWKTGIRATGTLSAINGFLGKVAQAAAGGISGLLLSWGAYDADAVHQTANALDGDQDDVYLHSGAPDHLLDHHDVVLPSG